ncbi:hypothetical protein OS493_021955 [Desmophyllum pertusum]|uniref:Uncharacterized protein n=1 Tax=Desmophyllum pertusum TaxID=174260 RepID=A0A9W9ZDG1_9CNID|nr:hypothetical protein OS493_021955 [Desmophyllum pertusum]
MSSQRTSVLFVSSLVCLAAVVSFCEAGANRCLYTHGDPHCDVTGTFPLQLSCSYPGKWFTIKSVSKQSIDGKWKKVPAAKSVSERDCKASRIVQQGRAGSYCTVSGSLPEISAVDEVKVEYYCWEINPDWLGGFGKRSRSQLKDKLFQRTTDVIA